MTSNKPYLLRALYEWISDNHMTPYIQVDTRVQGVSVPSAYVQDHQIVLNITMNSVKDLVIGNDLIEFHARFGGQSEFIVIPVDAVAAIFAKENGQGMGFDVDHAESSDAGSAGKSSHLKIVKS